MHKEARIPLSCLIKTLNCNYSPGTSIPVLRFFLPSRGHLITEPTSAALNTTQEAFAFFFRLSFCPPLRPVDPSPLSQNLFRRP